MPPADTRNTVSWGELLWDLFPSGACLGGAPSNFAVHLATLGVGTHLVTRVGKDALGTKANEALAQRGVKTSAVQFDAKLQTGRVGIALVDGEPRYTLHPGAWHRIQCDDEAISALRTTRSFSFGTLSQEHPEGLASWREALSHLPPNAIRFCDPNLRGGRIDAELVREHLRASTVVKINEDEARVLEATYECEDAVAWLLQDMRVDVVAKTLGPKGALIATREQTVRHAGIPATPGGDNVGAGDAFGAVLVAGLMNGAPHEELVAAANTYGSFVASKRGATPIPPAELLIRVRTLVGMLP